MRSVDMEYGLASRRDARNLFIRGGRVHCPAEGDIGVEICLECRHLRGLSGRQDGVVVCDFDADLLAPFDPGIPRGWTGRAKR
jgi:hypothetical protein